MSCKKCIKPCQDKNFQDCQYNPANYTYKAIKKSDVDGIEWTGWMDSESVIEFILNRKG